MPANTRRRGWCFTDNIPKGWAYLPKGVAYIIWQQEKVTKHHTQGYVEMKSSQRLSWLKANVSDTAHWEPRHGTQKEAITYCKKEESRVDKWRELGTPLPGQGKRMDIIDFKRSVRKSHSERELWEKCPAAMFKWYLMSQRLRILYPPPRTIKVHVTVAIGAHGTGKTHYGRYLDHLDEDVYVVPLARDGMWFSGYDGHKHVVMDDFDGRLSKLGLKELLRLTHNHTERVETKNGHAWWNPETIFITTNIRMENWYEWGERSQEGIKGRIHRILDFGDTINKICEEPKDVTDTYDWGLDPLLIEDMPTGSTYSRGNFTAGPFFDPATLLSECSSYTDSYRN